MSDLKDLVLPDDVKRPVPASPEVKKRLEAIWKDKSQLRRLYGLARFIVKSSAAIRRKDPAAGDDRPHYSKQLIEDLIYEAVFRILDGRRKWNLDKHPDAHVYLGGVIGSLWTHLCEQAKARKEAEQVAPDEEVFDWRTRRPLNPLELLIAKEEEEEYQRLQAFFAAEFDKTDKALEFLALTQDEIYDCSEQARLLGITIDEIYRLRERVKRTLVRFIEQRRRRNQP